MPALKFQHPWVAEAAQVLELREYSGNFQKFVVIVGSQDIGVDQSILRGDVMEYGREPSSHQHHPVHHHSSLPHHEEIASKPQHTDLATQASEMWQACAREPWMYPQAAWKGLSENAQKNWKKDPVGVVAEGAVAAAVGAVTTVGTLAAAAAIGVTAEACLPVLLLGGAVAAAGCGVYEIAEHKDAITAANEALLRHHVSKDKVTQRLANEMGPDLFHGTLRTAGALVGGGAAAAAVESLAPVAIEDAASTQVWRDSVVLKDGKMIPQRANRLGESLPPKPTMALERNNQPLDGGKNLLAEQASNVSTAAKSHVDRPHY